MRKNIVFTPLMVALVSGGALCAQDMSSAALAGRVTSQDGQPLQGVRVLAESPSMLGVRNTVTDANGQFRLHILPGGEYTITYTLNGYMTRRLTIRLVAGQTGNGNARMSSLSVQEEVVEILGTAAQVDKTDTVVSSSFTREQLDKIAGRNINNAAQLAPGLSNSDLFSEERDYIYMRGGTGNGIKMYVNGGLATQGWGSMTMVRSFTIGDLIESVAIIQSPVNARYGNTDAGLVSVVTSKGSNTYTGTIRLMDEPVRRNPGVMRNPGWRTTDLGYPNREGYMQPLGTANISGNDIMDKHYEVSFQGPIWKDRLTFSYGARLTPRTVTPQNLGTIWSLNPATGQYTGLPQNHVGTFYQDSESGDIIRKPELYLRNSYDGWFNRSQKNTYNHFGAYLQITPQHQLEWSYTQQRLSQVSMEGLHKVEDFDDIGTSEMLWNVAYKGIIGTSGVLDVHYGNTEFNWFNAPAGRTDLAAIYTMSFASRVPINPNLTDVHALNSFDNYYVNGLIDWNVGSGQFPGNFNPYAGYTNTFFNGPRRDVFNGGGTKTLSLNYQHHLDTKLGSHMIDVGYNSEKFVWDLDNGAEAPDLRIYSTGQIAYDLTAADIYNPNAADGRGTKPASAYAGKFIVFNTRTARYSDVDPTALSKYGIEDAPFFASINGDIGVRGGYFWRTMPYMEQRYGDEKSRAYTDMASYYVNDLWTLNDHHSVLLGVRVDNFKVYSDTREIHSYTQPTFRFEYKWDIHGDQGRMVNVSWAQFHNNIQAGGYRPMFSPRAQNFVTRFWDVSPDGSRNGSGVPWLVDIDQIVDPRNYGLTLSPVIHGGDIAFVDPDFKAPISTELAVGFRRNLSVGGFWKASVISRSWKNDYAFYPGEIFTNNIGTTDIQRVMKNGEGYHRSYNALELEWDIPITKRANFGGSYTYSRFMNNTPANAMDLAAHWVLQSAYRLNLDSWWDEQAGGREAWAPPLVTQPEHYFKFYLLLDLSRGNLASSLSFQGAYTSGGFTNDFLALRYGLPYERYPEIMTGPLGTHPSAPGAIGVGIFGNDYVPQYVNTRGTGEDNWNLRARYMLNVPLADKFTWMVAITILNPFNHRGRGGWSGPSGGWVPYIYPNQLYNPNGTPIEPDNRDPNQSIWRPGGNWNSLYQGRQSGREFFFETGLRF